MTIQSGKGVVQILLRNPDLITTGLNEITGPNGMLEASGWKRGFAQSNQPALAWTSNEVPFSGPEQLVGVVYLGALSGRKLRVTVSAPEDDIEDFYSQITPMLENMRIR